jgi:hypothetical protein
MLHSEPRHINRSRSVLFIIANCSHEVLSRAPAASHFLSFSRVSYACPHVSLLFFLLLPCVQFVATSFPPHELTLRFFLLLSHAPGTAVSSRAHFTLYLLLSPVHGTIVYDYIRLSPARRTVRLA